MIPDPSWKNWPLSIQLSGSAQSLQDVSFHFVSTPTPTLAVLRGAFDPAAASLRLSLEWILLNHHNTRTLLFHVAVVKLQIIGRCSYNYSATRALCIGCEVWMVSCCESGLGGQEAKKSSIITCIKSSPNASSWLLPWRQQSSSQSRPQTIINSEDKNWCGWVHYNYKCVFIIDSFESQPATGQIIMTPKKRLAACLK